VKLVLADDSEAVLGFGLRFRSAAAVRGLHPRAQGLAQSTPQFELLSPVSQAPLPQQKAGASCVVQAQPSEVQRGSLQSTGLYPPAPPMLPLQQKRFDWLPENTPRQSCGQKLQSSSGSQMPFPHTWPPGEETQSLGQEVQLSPVSQTPFPQQVAAAHSRLQNPQASPASHTPSPQQNESPPLAYVQSKGQN
jgi:hypothetical protein